MTTLIIIHFSSYKNYRKTRTVTVKKIKIGNFFVFLSIYICVGDSWVQQDVYIPYVHLSAPMEINRMDSYAELWRKKSYENETT